jgi:hypothetical protein
MADGKAMIIKLYLTPHEIKIAIYRTSTLDHSSLSYKNSPFTNTHEIRVGVIGN